MATALPAMAQAQDGAARESLLNPGGGSLLNPSGASLLRGPSGASLLRGTAPPPTPVSPITLQTRVEQTVPPEGGGVSGLQSSDVYVGPNGESYGVATDAYGRQVLVPLADGTVSGLSGAVAAPVQAPPTLAPQAVPFHIHDTGGVVVGGGQGAIVITDVMRPGTIKGFIVPNRSGAQ